MDLRTALICQVLANTHLAPDSTPYTIEDFMPREPYEQTPEDHFAAIEAANAMFGGTDERPKRTGA